MSWSPPPERRQSTHSSLVTPSNQKAEPGSFYAWDSGTEPTPIEEFKSDVSRGFPSGCNPRVFPEARPSKTVATGGVQRNPGQKIGHSGDLRTTPPGDQQMRAPGFVLGKLEGSLGVSLRNEEGEWWEFGIWPRVWVYEGPC